jgi:hypothetical protein
VTSVTGLGDAMRMSKQELIEAANEMTGDNIKDLSLDQLHRLITVALHVSDLCLNEIEDRRVLRRRGHTDPARVARTQITLSITTSILLAAPALPSRRSRFSRRLARRPDGIFVSDFEQGEIGPDLFRKACEFGFEGLVSKRRDRPYRGGPSKHWIKIKNRKHPAMSRVMEAFR